MEHIKYSEIESEVYGLKVGRAEFGSFPCAEIMDEILEKEYDVCRVKVNADNDELVAEMENMGMPFFFSGALTRFKIDFRNRNIGKYRYNPEFELYDGSQSAKLEEVLKDSFKDHPTSFYTVPYLESVISKEQEQSVLINYLKETKSSKNTNVWLVKVKGKYAGVIAAKFWEENGDAFLAGVTEKYKNTGLFLDIIRFIQNYCIKNNVDWGYTGARLHEVVSQKFFTREAMKVHTTELIFHVTSFLSKSILPPKTKSIYVKRKSEITVFIINAFEEMAKNYTPKKQNIKWFKPKCSGNINLVFSFPIISKFEKTIVVKIYKDKSIVGVGCFDFDKNVI